MKNLNAIWIRQRLYKQYFMENRIAEILWHGYTESRICDRIRPASLALLILKGEISMSEKRRDNRNRILREGEYQRTDGRYRYRYIDEDGKEKNVYSWRLDKNDPTPRGKKRELSLREKEKQIQADLFDHIVTRGGNYTVVELVEK